MAKAAYNWGQFENQVSAKDAEIIAATTQNFWDPPEGTYDCVIIDKQCRQYTNEKTNEVIFGFHVTYLILEHPTFKGKEFRSQFYKFTEQGLPWTKGFLATLAPPDTPLVNAEDLLKILNTVVEDQYQVMVTVTTRNYTTNKGPQTSIQDKILSCGFSTKVPEKSPTEVDTGIQGA